MGHLRKHWLAIANILVLIALLGVASALWYYWLDTGHKFVHSRVSQQAGLPAISASSPSPGQRDVMAEIGQAGDAFGAVNALFAALAGAAVIWAGWLQIQTLNKTRDALQHEQYARKLEQFESKFFSLLELHRSMVHRIDAYRTPTSLHLAAEQGTYQPKIAASGEKAVDALAQTVHRIMQKKKHDADHNLVSLTRAFIRIYHVRPSAFGAYFRTFFQAMKAIDTANIPDEKKIEYASIARAQMSDGAVLLFALNACTPFGRESAYYIEKYGMLKHMLITYRTAYEKMLTPAIRDRAFQDAAQRGSFDSPRDPLKLSPPMIDLLAFQINPIVEDELAPEEWVR
jgi:hypothetical protein